ncbi:MAG: hypothetical protein GX308_01280 [Epulopiscium sp.]|nr:hypothetical protein [Candidatus Epulonipiscium sp.]
MPVVSCLFLKIISMVVCVIAFAFVLVQFIIISNIKKQKFYISNEVEPHDFNLVPEINQNLIKAIEIKLHSKGFVFENDYKATIKNQNQIIYFRRFINKEVCAFANIYYSYATSTQQIQNKEIATKTEKYSFDILTKFTDNTRVLSKTQNEPMLFPYENTTIFICEDINDIEHLIEEHITKVKEMMQTKYLDDSDYSKSIQESTREASKMSYDFWVKNNLLYYNSEENYYSFTYSGAIKASLKYQAYNLSRKSKKKSTSFDYTMESKKTKIKSKTFVFIKTLDYLFFVLLLISIFLTKVPSVNFAQVMLKLGLLFFSLIGTIITSAIRLFYKPRNKDKII